MGWRVESREDPHRYIAWVDDGEDMGRLDGDPASLEELTDLIDSEAAVALTPTGPFRDVDNSGDQMGVYLFARQTVVPAPHEIIGTPPTEYAPGADLPEGAVA